MVASIARFTAGSWAPPRSLQQQERRNVSRREESARACKDHAQKVLLPITKSAAWNGGMAMLLLVATL